MNANKFLESKKNKERSFPKDSYAAYWDISEKSEKTEKLREIVEEFSVLAGGPALVLGFAPADSDFTAVGQQLRRELPEETHLLVVSSEGGIYRQEGYADLYCPGMTTGVILHGFSRRMMRQVQILSFPLPDDDIRKHQVDMRLEERVDVLKKKLQQCHLEFPLNSQDTLAMTYMDGLSICENIAMQAVYESQCFPCAFVGGSAGADAAKRHSYIYDGQKTLERSLIICLIKLQPGYRFAAFNTNNIESILKEYTVIDANSTLQTVYKVVDAETGCQDVIAALKKTFGCESLVDLKRALKPYVFGTEIGGRLYARDMRHIEESHNCLHFHCGFAMGEKIMLLKYNGLEQHVREDWKRFMHKKTQPFAGIIFDCKIHRTEQKRADFADLFEGVDISGFSGRGEIMGIPMNNSLAAVFFFKVADGEFIDQGNDDFPVRYAEYKSYFTLRRLRHVQIVNDMERKAQQIVRRNILQQQCGDSVGKHDPADVAEAFSQALNEFNMEKILGYTGEKKMRKILATIKNGGIDSRDGEISTLVSYMQIMMDQLHAQRHMLEKQVRRMERYIRIYAKDELTNAYARRSGYAILRQLLGGPSDEVDFLTMAFVDLDNLKAANDLYGHEEGDIYLKTVVDLLMAELNDSDIICRFGGDEFVLALPNKFEENAHTLLQKVNRQLAVINACQGKGYRMSFSFGTLFYDYSEPLDVESAIKQMDSRMYNYKLGQISEPDKKKKA